MQTLNRLSIEKCKGIITIERDLKISFDSTPFIFSDLNHLQLINKKFHNPIKKRKVKKTFLSEIKFYINIY